MSLLISSIHIKNITPKEHDSMNFFIQRFSITIYPQGSKVFIPWKPTQTTKTQKIAGALVILLYYATALQPPPLYRYMTIYGCESKENLKEGFLGTLFWPTALYIFCTLDFLSSPGRPGKKAPRANRSVAWLVLAPASRASRWTARPGRKFAAKAWEVLRWPWGFWYIFGRFW